MKPRALIMSIKPKYVRPIFNGLKTVELRRNLPADCKMGTGVMDVIIYATAPDSALVGHFKIGKIWSGTPNEVWEMIASTEAGVSRQEYNDYFMGAGKAYALGIVSPYEFDNPLLKIDADRTFDRSFVAPQGWRYALDDEAEYLLRYKPARKTPFCT